jgi:adenosylmethionine-8-amino-7-oxononanoate aminotransferase
MREPFMPLLPPSIHIPAPYCLRCYFGLTYPSCGIRCAHALEEAIWNEGRKTISAFLAETVLGSTIGAVVPPSAYYAIVREICSRYGILLILDEVMCGMGRTGKWFGLDHYGVVPDMITLGKGLNGGYAALSAVGCREEHLEVLRDRSGNFIHGHTFSHHAVAAAAALSVVDILEKENLVEQAESRGNYLEQCLRPLTANSHVGQIRGIGLMWAIEVVRDKESLEPYPRKDKIAEQLADQLTAMGVLTYKCTGFAHGDGDAVMLGPPFIISESEIDFTVHSLQQAIDQLP